MLEFLVAIIFEVLFVEVLGRLIGLKFKAVYFIGVGILKFITRSDKPVKELAEQYKDSSKPYFLGFGVIIGLAVLIVQLT